MNAASKSGVNPYVLAAMILQEQGTNGTGKCISGTVAGYQGYYNFFNIEAYQSGSMDATVSYTHLDVYKRQRPDRSDGTNRCCSLFLHGSGSDHPASDHEGSALSLIHIFLSKSRWMA